MPWTADRQGFRHVDASLSRIVRRLDLSRQKTRPLHPQVDERAKAAFAKGVPVNVCCQETIGT